MNRLLDKLIGKVVRRGRLVVTWSDRSVSTYGDGSGPAAHIALADRGTEREILLNPELAIGEAFTEGRITFPDSSLAAFFDVININWKKRRPTAWTEAMARMRYLVQRVGQSNTVQRARGNIAYHYDLDERLYRLFLDSDMQYSCAYFERPGVDLDTAQLAKKRHIAAKLALKPGQEVLDIGSGWGGLGMYLAEMTGVYVTGVTLSAEQHRVSTERARQRGLAEKVRFELVDYRKLDRSFDRIVSVGMFEHVGLKGYQEYFDHAYRLLKPDGVMLLHSIGRAETPGPTNPWLTKYIFPGGYIPSISEVIPRIEQAGLIVTDLEVLRLHYAETLKLWRERFMLRRAEAVKFYDERFARMWEFYLAGSESAFRSGTMMNIQVQLARQQTALPLTRDYMFTTESALKDRQCGAESLRMAGA